jgi:polysaccharide deacetylase 2 family uncharacterized protein YibQ
MINKTPRQRGREPWPRFNQITAILLGAALVSVVVLDNINRGKGEPSYLFARRGAGPAPKVQVPPEKAVKPEMPPPAEEAKPRPETKREVPARKPSPGEVALIIDDMGNSLEVLGELLNLRQPVTIAVLPYSDHAGETARIAHENNLEVLLHLPLESLNNHDASSDSQGIILAGMTPEEIVQSFEDCLARVPYADGVNNHMGSKFTADRSLMRTLLIPLRDRGLFFVDSRTTAQTVAYAEAIRMGVPAVERNVFLDADADRGRIRSRIVELFKLAQKKGRAVGIGHPYPETLEALRTDLHLFENYGLEVVPVSRLVHK